MLKIKQFTELLQSMVDYIGAHTKKLTNFSIGSVLRTILEAVSSEISELYYEMYKNFKKAIKLAIFYSFGFELKPAQKAKGVVRMYFKGQISHNVIVPKGFKFVTTITDSKSLYFESIQDVVSIPFDNYIDVPVECTTPGIDGNVPEHSIRTMLTPLAYIDYVDNEEPTGQGREEETEDECKKRFSEYIETLSKGTMDAIRYGCISTPGITGVYLEEHIGFVKAYAHDVNGELPEELKKALIENLINYRSGGTPVYVSAVLKKEIDLNISVLLSPEVSAEEYKSIITNSIKTYLNAYTVGSSLLRSELIRYIMSIDRLAIINIELENMTSDIAVKSNEVIRSGIINITIE